MTLDTLLSNLFPCRASFARIFYLSYPSILFVVSFAPS
jgi:hypothetical protein